MFVGCFLRKQRLSSLFSLPRRNTVMVVMKTKKAHQYLRVRPVTDSDVRQDATAKPHATASVPSPFLKMMDETASTSQVYESTCCRKVVFNAVAFGISGAILAYGQRSSGKSHTMIGSKDSPGILHLAAADLMKQAKHFPHGESITMSVIAVLDNKVFDVCNGAKEAKLHGCNVDAVRIKLDLKLVDELASFTKTGWKVGDIAHLIVCFHIPTMHQLDNKENKAVVPREAVLALVDLAGTEPVGRAGSTGRIPREHASVVESLYSLMQIVRTLGTEHVLDFRRCCLTKVLKPYLVRSANVAFLHCVTPSQLHDLRVHQARKSNVRKIQVEKARKILQDEEDGAPIPVETLRRSRRIADKAEKERKSGSKKTVVTPTTTRLALADIDEQNQASRRVEPRRRSTRISALGEKKLVHNCTKELPIGVLKPCKYTKNREATASATNKSVSWDDTLERIHLIPRRRKTGRRAPGKWFSP